MTGMDAIKLRTYRYYYQDGLAELVVGAFFVAIGLLLLLAKAFLSQSPLAAWAAGLGLVVVTFGAVFGVKRFFDAVKERLVYPRTGYVAYREQSRRGRWIIVWAALLISICVLAPGFLGIDVPVWTQRMALTESWLLGIVLCTVGYRVGMSRYYVLAVITLIAGLGAALTGLDDISGSLVTFGATGLALLVSGGLAFAHYLSANPLPAEVS